FVMAGCRKAQETPGPGLGIQAPVQGPPIPTPASGGAGESGAASAQRVQCQPPAGWAVNIFTTEYGTPAVVLYPDENADVPPEVRARIPTPLPTPTPPEPEDTAWTEEAAPMAMFSGPRVILAHLPRDPNMSLNEDDFWEALDFVLSRMWDFWLEEPPWGEGEPQIVSIRGRPSIQTDFELPVPNASKPWHARILVQEYRSGDLFVVFGYAPPEQWNTIEAVWEQLPVVCTWSGG
ncbi:MAG: hypothetical protein GXO36_04920, partial [Chloroflexi bacterium]|nr:hypothetical protein [Chloroflexota bacterium]